MKVILVMAMTLDGVIAKHKADPVDWTGKGDKKKFVEITKRAGVVIMGSTTFNTIGRMLPKRKNIVMTRKKELISSDYASQEQKSAGAGVEKTGASEGELIFTDKSPAEIVRDLEKEGFDSAALIGGSTINGLFAKEKLIDEIYVTIIPRLFGKGLPLIEDEVDLELELISTEAVDSNAILLHYRVVK